MSTSFTESVSEGMKSQIGQIAGIAIVAFVVYELLKNWAIPSATDTAEKVAGAINDDTSRLFEWAWQYYLDTGIPHLPDDVIVDNLGHTAGYYYNLGYGDFNVYKMYYAKVTGSILPIADWY